MAAMVCKHGADDPFMLDQCTVCCVCVHTDLQAFSFFPLLVPPRNPSLITSLCVFLSTFVITFFLLNKRIQYNVFRDMAERKMKRKHWTRLTLCDVIVNSLWVYSVTRILKYNGRMHEKPKCTLGADRCFKMKAQEEVLRLERWSGHVTVQFLVWMPQLTVRL